MTYLHLRPPSLAGHLHQRVPLAGVHAHGVALPEHLGHVLIELDVQVLLLCHPLVPGAHPIFDPLNEAGADDGVDHVGDVLLAQLLDLALHRQRLHYGLVALGVLEQVGDRQPLVLRDADVLDIFREDLLLPAGRQVLQVPDRHGLEGVQVEMGVAGEEAVDLALVLVLGGELL